MTFSLTAVLWQRTTSVLDSVLSQRGKRVVFLASLAARLGSTHRFDKQTRQKLNTIMKLVHGESALLLPYELSAVIWHGKSGVEIFHFDPKRRDLSQEQICQMTQSVVNSMPAWLRYGENTEIEQDIVRLLHNRTQVFGF